MVFAPSNFPVLFLDAASPTIFAGLHTTAAAPVEWHQHRGEAGTGVFGVTSALLRGHDLRVNDLAHVVYCDGPGSLLGIRIVAMALRTWGQLPRVRPLRVSRYRSLALVAADLLARGQTGPFSVLSDARRNTWNVLAVSTDGTMSEIERVSVEQLSSSAAPSFTPDSFPSWQSLPDRTERVPYRPEKLPELAARFPLLAIAEKPDAFMTELPTYRTWSPTP